MAQKGEPRLHDPVCYRVSQGYCEVSVIGDYVKFIKVNASEPDEVIETEQVTSDELSFMIDAAIDKFFHNHVMKFTALGKDMVPAMMGMMGMMSFKGMMFSMMSFMMAKMMLLMKLLEKKGGGHGLGSGGDASWPAAAGGGGAWVPAGGDYGGGSGGYDANGQWQSRSIVEKMELDAIHNRPIISYVTPYVRYHNLETNALQNIKKHNANENLVKSRKKRGIVDALQYIYAYWINRILGNSVNRRIHKTPYYRYVNGIKYVYQPMKIVQKLKQQKDTQNNYKPADSKPIMVAEDFNKGEIIEGVVERRMNRKKLSKLKDSINDTLDDNPWE
ncbi:hypothetical protein ACJJTC_014205 [Scirpophaga incertulas]